MITRSKLFTVICLMLLALASCQSAAEKEARNDIENEVSKLKKQLPMQVDAATLLTDVEYEDDMMTYYYTFDEDMLSYGDLLMGREEMKQNMITTMSSSPKMEGLVKSLKEAKSDFRFYYRGSKTGKSFFIDIKSSEIH